MTVEDNINWTIPMPTIVKNIELRITLPYEIDSSDLLLTCF